MTPTAWSPGWHRASAGRPAGWTGVRRRWFVLAFWLVWAQGMASTTEPCDPVARRDSAPLYVVRRGWHVDVAFAAADLEFPLRSLLAKFPGAQYLSFGFGDRRYLMASHRGTPAMLEALWPGPGLVLVTGLRATPADAFGAANVIALPRSREQLFAAQGFVWHSFTRSARALSASQPMPDDNDSLEMPDEVARGPYTGSSYFASQLEYSGVHTCNTWAAETMKGASLPMRTRGVVFAGQVWKRSLKIAAAD